MKKNLLYRIVTMGLLSGLAATAQELQVYPSTIQLDHGSDFQNFMVIYTKPSGISIDVTSEAVVSPSQEGIVTIAPGVARPAADGALDLTVTYESLSVTVPVTSGNTAVHPAISFRQDVEAVLLRAGCNSGKCHGSAKGKNGFRMSLFGFDAKMDYQNLTRQARGRRLNAAIPEESLILLKTTGSVDHEGGAVLDPDYRHYSMLKQWITEGAKNDAPDIPELTGIEILPKYRTIPSRGARQRFIVTASYSNGNVRDVTDLAVFASGDDLVITVDEWGQSTTVERGETYIMARFGTFAVVSQVVVVPEDLEFTWPEDAVAHNYIDESLFDKLKKLRVAPAVLAEDAVFLRRVYLDILGVLPTAEEARAYHADEDPDKRARLIDTLLDRPEFADVWAMKWAESLRVASTTALKPKGMHRYNDWLREAITQNKPLDELVRELLTASGGTFAKPASNFYVIEPSPTLMAENVTQVFMGVQITCAQCHNHPFERWTMEDYYSFSSFFAQVGRKSSSDPREQIVFNQGSGEVKNLKDGQVMKPKFLGGAEPDTAGRDRRELLAEWLTAPENPWFAKNIANRVWAHFFGKGIVDPVDDVRVSNPPSNAPLLEKLAQRLIETDYDLRGLVRDVCNSYAYQQASAPRDPNIRDERNFAYAYMRRLPAEQLLDAVCQTTKTRVKFAALPLGARAMQVANGDSGNYFLDVFGRPKRESVCACERGNEPTLAQTLHLINGNTIQSAITQGGNVLEEQLAAETPNEALLENLYLAAYSRYPRDDEKESLMAFLSTEADRKELLEDLYWTVLNSKEFILNH